MYVSSEIEDPQQKYYQKTKMLQISNNVLMLNILQSYIALIVFLPELFYLLHSMDYFNRNLLLSLKLTE